MLTMLSNNVGKGLGQRNGVKKPYWSQQSQANCGKQICRFPGTYADR